MPITALKWHSQIACFVGPTVKTDGYPIYNDTKQETQHIPTLMNIEPANILHVWLIKLVKQLFLFQL